RSLTLVRDRLGIKPLYYGWAAGQLAFGSELKALRRVPGFANPVHRGALALFLRHNYIPDPWSVYQGIYKVMPGTWITLGTDTIGRRCSVEELAARATVYWSAKDVVDRGCAAHTSI